MPKGYFLPYQVDWIIDPSAAMLGDKARRIGLTYCDSYKTIRDRSSLDHRRDLWFSSADESAAFEYALYCRQWCELQKLIYKEVLDILEDDKGYKFNNYVVELPNGCRINSMTSNPRRFRSKGGDVVLDEFDWHDDPGAMLDAAMPVTTWGYNIRILTTRSREGTPFDNLVKLVKKVQRGEITFDEAKTLNWHYHYLPITIAVEQGLAEKIYKLDHVDQTSREKFLKECRARCRNDDAYMQEYMCTPSTNASTLIPYDLYQSCESGDCLIPQLATEGEHAYYVGVDVGREQHKTKIWINELLAGIIISRKVITLSKQPYGVQLKVMDDLLANPKVIRLCGDATGIGDMLIETLADRHGSHRVEKVKFTEAIKDHLANQLLSRFEDKRIRVPDDIKIRESFHKIRKTVTLSGHIRYDAATTEEGHADDFWAEALSVEAASKQTVLRCYA